LSLNFESLDLLHEVSLRSASNRMDAHNLAVVVCPNLVKGSNPAQDVMMCSVPGGPVLFEARVPSSPMRSPRSPVPSTPAAIVEHKTTLGSVIKLAIQRYYEVFDEVRDRSEAWPLPEEHGLSSSSSQPSFPSQSFQRANGQTAVEPAQRWSVATDGDEEIDDTMLVMPIGPSSSGGKHRSTLSRDSNGMLKKFAPSASASASVHVPHSSPSGYNATVSKARSTISIDRNKTGLGGKRSGSISVGHRGTVGGGRKSVGSGVEAIGITAEGFFSAPAGEPPVPPLPGKGGSST
jgi:Rho GTPase-activating protein 1